MLAGSGLGAWGLLPTQRRLPTDHIDRRRSHPPAYIANTKTQRHEGRPHTRFAHRFLDSTFGSARNDIFFAVPSVRLDRESGATFHAVIPTERAERTSGGIHSTHKARSGQAYGQNTWHASYVRLSVWAGGNSKLKTQN